MSRLAAHDVVSEIRPVVAEIFGHVVKLFVGAFFPTFGHIFLLWVYRF